ncbi:MAG TPA: 30S ribosomal protein S16 [Verrucomicrobiae bacterium]|nr:30S ribosomal protein S16 [Verrucomicrobiae bacterium]
MLAIRLTRTGKIHDPHYRIVVQEKRSKLNGKYIDLLGHYHPAQADKQLVVNKEKTEEWLAKGAQPSDTVTNLLVKAGIFDKSRRLSNFYTPTKKEEVVAEAPAVEVAEEAAVEEPAAELVEETPAEETPAEEVVAEPEAAPEEAVATEEPATEEEAQA